MSRDWFDVQWPTLTPADRREVFALKAIWSPPLTQSPVANSSDWIRSLGFDLESAANSALLATLGRTDLPHIEVEEVAGGPTAEGEIFDFILTVWEHHSQIRDYLIPLYTAAAATEFLGRVVKHFRDLEQSWPNSGRPSCEISFTPKALALACEWQVSEVTDDPGPFEASIELATTDLSFDNPDERLQYKVSLSGNYTHDFVLTATGRVLGYTRDNQQIKIEQWSDSIIPNVDNWPVQMPLGVNWITGEVERHWPTQDGVDRSGTIAFLIAGPFYISQPISTGGSILERFTIEAVREVLDSHARFSPTAKYYQVGPAAGGIDQFIVTLFNSRDEIGSLLGLAADTWAISEIARRVYRRVKYHFQQSSEEATLYFPVETLILFCEDHIRRNYHPRARLKCEWHCLTQEFYGGYSSPGHPTPMVEYLIVVETVTKRYRFRVRGSGEVLAFSMEEGKTTFPLKTPTLLEDQVEEQDGKHAQ